MDAEQESGTSNALVYSDKNWNADQWQGGFIEITSATGAGQVRTISGNTSNSITVSPNWTTPPASDSQYQVFERSAYRAMFFKGSEDYGVATSGSSTTLVDTSKSWAVNAWQGGGLAIVDGSGAEPSWYSIVNNDSHTITVHSPFGTTPDDTSRYVIVKELLWDREVPPRVMSQIVRLFPQIHGGYQQVCQSSIDTVSSTLSAQLDLVQESYIKIPAMFRRRGLAGKADALMPNMVNSLIANGKIVIPKPFGPVDGGADVFETEMSARIPGDGEVFVDDWDDYHRDYGEIHCGTNVRRSMPMLWWWY